MPPSVVVLYRYLYRSYSGQSSNDTSAHDLPAELLDGGWRKFYSKREGIYYFYNKITNESKWEMPDSPVSGVGVTTATM